MNDENAKVLIALVLKTENGVFLKRSEVGKFSLPSRFLKASEQPEDVVKELTDELGIAQADFSASKVDIKNISIREEHTENIVVILTTYFLTSGNSLRDRLVEVSTKNLARTHLNRITKEILEIDNTLQNGDEKSKNIDSEGRDGNVENISSDRTLNEYKKIRIFSDGGSRGNPGPSACGFIIEDETGVELYRGGEYLGITTNNQAEYQGVRLALEKALALGAQEIDLKGDSLLVINQMNGIYKIKNKDLWPIYERIKELVTKFHKVTFAHVYREYNRGADAMVNEILDQHAENIK
jgi:ribonuclease HI